MEPEVPVKKLETMVKLDAVRRAATPPPLLAGDTHAQLAHWRARQTCPERATLT